MKILTINNTIFYYKENKIFLNKETGVFFERLSQLNNEVTAFQIGQPKTDFDNFANFDLKAGQKVKIVMINRNLNRLIPFIKAFFIIPKLIFLNDFVYLFYPGPICQVIACFCILFNKNYGIYVRGEQGIDTKLSRFIIKNAKIVNTISPKFTDQILNINKNSFTIRPMIGFDEEDIIFTRNFDLLKKANILYVGRLVYDKGLFELLSAINILREKFSNIHLTIIGDGPDLIGLKKTVDKLNIQNNVTFTGMISEKEALIEYYKRNDIFVLPTYHEGFPRVIYEALIMRIPILTTFVGTIGYLMKNNNNCIELKPKDVNSIVDGISRVISEQGLAEYLSKTGTETIVNYLVDKKENHANHLNKYLKRTK